MKTILKIVVGVVIAVILVIVGLSLLIGGAVNSAQKDQDKNGMTKAQFVQVKNGVALVDFKQKFGKPSDQQVTQTKGFKSVCIYYPISGGEFADEYQFCFDNGKLSSKAHY